MPYKDKDKQRKAQAEYAARRRATYGQEARRKRKEFLAQCKDQPCTDCGVKYPPYVMDLDHLPGTDKVMHVSRLISSNGIQAVKEEIKKCEVVCANCHRERTFQRANGNVEGSNPPASDAGDAGGGTRIPDQH